MLCGDLFCEKFNVKQRTVGNHQRRRAHSIRLTSILSGATGRRKSLTPAGVDVEMQPMLLFSAPRMPLTKMAQATGGTVQRKSRASLGRRRLCVTSQETAILLVDAELRPAYANPEALRILDRDLAWQHGDSLRHVLPPEVCGLATEPRVLLTEFIAGASRYRCTLVPLGACWNGTKGKPLMAVLIEPSRSSLDCLDRAVSLFRLTSREKETLKWLLAGCTTKTIAVRMDISPNTVKAFLRQVMLKMGVSTRSSVLRTVFELAIGLADSDQTEIVGVEA